MRRIRILSVGGLFLIAACGGGGGGGSSGGPPGGSVGTLGLWEGLMNPAATGIPTGAQDVTALQITLTATPAEDIRLDSVSVRGAGTGDESADVAGVELWLDSDGDGVAGAGDTLLGGPLAYAADEGTITFTLGATAVPAGGAVDLIVIYDFQIPGAAAASATFEAFVYDWDILGTGLVTGRAAPVGGDPAVIGGTLTVLLVELFINLGPSDLVIPSSTTISPGDRERRIMQFSLSANGVPADVTSITFGADGTGDDGRDVTGVTIYRDMNGDGMVDPVLDPPMGTGPGFSLDDGETTVPVAFTVPVGATWDLILTYRFKGNLPGGTGNDFRARIAGPTKVITSPARGTLGSAMGKYITVFR